MADLLKNPPAELQRPDYNIYRYTDQIYKIVRFKSCAPVHVPSDPKEHQSYDHKLDASLSRSRRVILELGLCNPWKYFCTFTLSKDLHDRKNLGLWVSKFPQWIRDQRKKYGIDIPYLLVPELHGDGSWHMHGFFGDISPLLVSFEDEYKNGMRVPWKLVEGGFYDWPDYRQKFGFCSLGLIKNQVAAGFYVTKYVTKSLQADCLGVGLHLYYCSQKLNRSSLHGDVYGFCNYLDQFLTNHYDFCDTGMTHVRNDLDWSFGMEFMDSKPFEVFSFDHIEPEQISFFEDYFSGVQIALEGF